MRTSVASYIDYERGLETFLEKKKPIRNARGIATVQLFDAVSGKRVLESKTENLITDFGLTFLRRSIFAGMLSGYSGTQPPNLNNYFGFINLLDMAVEEKQVYSLKEVGGVVGYANLQTYSGSDTMRGSINVQESAFDYNDYLHMHYVFDWPTHAGNGTFQMIGWRYDTEFFMPAYTFFSSPDSYPRGLAWDGQYLWLAGDSQDRIYKLNPSTGAVVSSFPSPDSYPRGLAWDGQYLWLAGYDTRKIYKLNPSTGAVVSSFPSPDSYPQGLAWDGQYLWLAGDSQDRIYKLYIQFGAITLLPAPVTKTSTNTMKVQYDFVFEL